MKKLPIGIQTIEEIIDGGYVYVDKTASIFQLISDSKYYFLSKPRRFGKSLLISTLKAIFNGDKELFKDCQIYGLDYKWEKHPIIHLDFTQILTKSAEDLKASLKRKLVKIAESYGKSIDTSSLQESLTSLVEKLSENGQVVVLVDEYDKPLIDNLTNLAVAEANRELLNSFFETLKGLDSHLRFIFVTGVSKFSQVSLFSGFNHLKDITIHPAYATLLGYTEEEVSQFFDDRIKKIASERNQSNTQVIAEMREWYNGYRFSWGQPTVYNPYSTLSFLDTGRTQSYWFRTGTPSFLIEQVKKLPQTIVQLSGVRATESELLDIHTLSMMSLKALMWQTGYLTIQEYDQKNSLYQLDFPNKEVRKAFFDSLIQEFVGIESSSINLAALECKKELEHHDIKSFFRTINIFFAKIPYSLFNKGDEGTYQAIFLSLLEAMGIKVHAEEQTNVGRIDLLLEMAKIIYIFEFKIDKTADEALEQIGIKKYKEKFSKHNKEIATIGANFSSKKRNVADWKAIIYFPDGKEKLKLESENNG